MTRRVAILGSTGSIGRMALEVVAAHPEQLRVVALSAGSNVDLVVQQAEYFRPELVTVDREEDARALQERLPKSIQVDYGMRGLCHAASLSSADLVLTAVIGARGLRPTLAAIDAGKDIALANKETLVAGGELVMGAARSRGVDILPVDSEHCALFQCLAGRGRTSVDRLVLTASGGAFRDRTRAELAHVSVSDALAHPNWAMGAKITIDSATLMNKGLEIIEAHFLFDQPYDKIDVVLHAQSIVHSMVEFTDGAWIAQLGPADMRIPIQWALTYPDALPGSWRRLSFEEAFQLDFRPWQPSRFPALRLAYQAGRAGGSSTAVLNAANETAVAAFLSGELPFVKIEEIVDSALQGHSSVAHPSLEDVLHADAWARDHAHRMIQATKGEQ